MFYIKSNVCMLKTLRWNPNNQIIQLTCKLHEIFTVKIHTLRIGDYSTNQWLSKWRWLDPKTNAGATVQHCIVLCLFYVTFRYARLDTSIVLTLHYTAQNMLAGRHNINRHQEYSPTLGFISLSLVLN